ncbi:hypothetical protein J7F03_28420 [Streptomyces sp. ISL-43]|uniref:hypothetical protein n=1 Tax=Streptomyces sp. ISL-43 TaxID=2819183 RepID=UPI001BE62EB1|nr:hypothetical protein [Streptomyces sp. ISL-43]MBT2450930.1 hypothetical protein [Streptomyces sp. ISL-43]
MTVQRPALQAAVAAALDQQTRGPQDSSLVAGIDADAKLYGTPAWDALPESRRAIVAQRVLNAARAGAEQEHR